jgi:beta-catenin-like protein 1
MSSSNVAVKLDRLISGNNIADTDDISNPSFVASATWQGSKPGYYFGTSNQGTGYYQDSRKQHHPSKQKNVVVDDDNDGTVVDHSNNQSPRKKSVRIAEDNNEIKILLEQLEAKSKDAVVVELSAKGTRAAAKSLQSIYQKNLQQRATFADDPQKYMDSEVQLYEQLTGLQAVGADPSLYEHVANSPLIATLIQLLGHDNADVCASVISLFLEWIDPSYDDPEVLPIVKKFAKSVLEAWESILYNLLRFQHETPEPELDDVDHDNNNNLKGMENTLSLMENLMELDTVTAPEGGLLGEDHPSVASYMVREGNGKIVSWLLTQLESTTVRENFQARCLELLAMLSQNEDVYDVLPNWANIPSNNNNIPVENANEPPIKKLKPSTINAIEDLIQIIAQYRKKQPNNELDIEMLENACIAMSSCISFSKDNMSAFLDAQGTLRKHAVDARWKFVCKWLMLIALFLFVFLLHIGRCTSHCSVLEGAGHGRRGGVEIIGFLW